MATCPICPTGDDEVPSEMMTEHLRLIHGDDPRIRMIPLDIHVPDGLDREQADMVMHMIGSAIEPLVARIAYLEDRCRSAFTAGYRDGWAGAVEHTDEIASKLIAECDQPGRITPVDTYRNIAYGVHKVQQAAREITLKVRDETPDTVTPAEIVHVLNGLEQPDWGDLEYAVAVAPADQTFDYQKRAMVDKRSWFPFSQGEILIVKSDGREPFGERRHVRKWGVQFEYTKDLHEAQTIRLRVVDAAKAQP